MKIIFTAAFFLAFAINGFSQSWVPLGSGCGTNDQNEGITALDTFNGQLIAIGNFNTAGGVAVNYIAAWDGHAWSSLGGGITFNNPGGIFAMAVYNGELYIAGEGIITAGGIPVNNVAKWNGVTWSDVGCRINTDGTGGVVQSMGVYNNELYVGGYFADTIGSVPIYNIARWNGSTWDSVGGGTDGDILDAFITYNGKLYVGGQFFSVGGITASNIASWDGTSWSSVGLGLGGFAQLSNPQVSSMIVFNGNLYVSGSFDTAGTSSSSGFAQWNGTAWSSLPNNGNQYGSNAMTVFNNELIAESLIGSGFGIAQFNNNAWSNLLGNLSNPVSQEYGLSALCVWNENLYVGGQFTEPNGSANILNIAEYSATTGIAEAGADNRMNIYPNPASGILYIENIEPNTPLTIIDMLGQILMKQFPETSKESIDISSLPAGIYSVNGKRFIKE
jgi:hypothetical protein